MKKTEIKGVVFDMDGLMFDSERIVQLSWDQAGERMGLGKLGHNIYHTLGFNREKRKNILKRSMEKGSLLKNFRSFTVNVFRNM